MKTAPLYILLLFLFSCAPGGTTTGNPVRVQMEFSSYNNSIAKLISNWFIPEAHAALSDLKMCFKRVRFKVEDSSAGKDIELELGEVVIKQEGTPLGEVEVSNAVYKRVEFDLEKDCDGSTKPSVDITNGFGNFTTNDKITIRFEGEFSAGDGSLDLFVQNIIDQVKNYQLSDGAIKDQLEAVSGTF